MINGNLLFSSQLKNDGKLSSDIDKHLLLKFDEFKIIDKMLDFRTNNLCNVLKLTEPYGNTRTIFFGNYVSGIIDTQFVVWYREYC